jgi:hypothetical protein
MVNKFNADKPFYSVDNIANLPVSLECMLARLAVAEHPSKTRGKFSHRHRTFIHRERAVGLPLKFVDDLWQR